MKALFPVFCRPLGYVVLLVALFLLPILLMQGLITDHNLLFYKYEAVDDGRMLADHLCPKQE